MAIRSPPGSLASNAFISTSSPPSLLLKLKGFHSDLFKTKVESQFYCGLCRGVLRWPMQTTCGCRFCYGCISNYIKHDDEIPDDALSCPTCDDTFNPAEIIRDNYSRKQLEKATVYCQNKVNGCQDEMKLKDLDAHLEGCTFQKIDCIHKSQGCSAVLIRGKLAEHLHKECQFRLATCNYCDEQFSVADMKSHQDKCEAYLVECPNKCSSEKIHQEKMERHLHEDCPLVEVNCFFKSHGCRYKSVRREMRIHKRDVTSDHVQLVVKGLEETRLKMSETQLLMQELSNNSGIVESQVKVLTDEVASIQISSKKTETHCRELQKLAAKHSDQMETIETQVRQAAKKEDVVEMKKTMFKPMQEKHDQMDDRLKRVEREGVGHGGGGGGSNAGGVSNARMTSVENQLGMHAVRLAEHDLRFQVQETANYEGVLLWKIKDFARRKRDADSGKTLSLYSQPFYTSRYGYKMCARIYLNGDGMGKGTHVSLFFVVMRGDYDALLAWPFRQKVTLMLLDQDTGRRHLSDSFRPDPKSSSFQRPTTEMNIASGCPLFVNQSVLKDSTYVKDDVAFLKVIVDTADLYGP